MKLTILVISWIISSSLLASCDVSESYPDDLKGQFTLAVIPDSQGMVNYQNQKAEGFSIDAAELFLEQMHYLADNAFSRGGDIAFVTSVGDVWQHRDNKIDSAHYERGLRVLPGSDEEDNAQVLQGIKTVEIPLAKRGYDLLAAADVIFSVAPGNSTYDTQWQDSRFPSDISRIDELEDEQHGNTRGLEILGGFHFGGFEKFNSLFGDSSSYFKDKTWYIGSFNGGANSAQIFSAGGYRFLHLAFEMHPGDKVLAWGQSVINRHPKLPTIITTHDFINSRNQRRPVGHYDLSLIDPFDHNDPEVVWQKFIAVNSQVFLVLSGHQLGQGLRIDRNNQGGYVYQIMANYQARGQVALTKEGRLMAGIGDGWVRLMSFDMSLDTPTLAVRTYSTHYKKYADEIDDYSDWYKKNEQPEMSDVAFIEADNFTLQLNDFKRRYGVPKKD